MTKRGGTGSKRGSSDFSAQAMSSPSSCSLTTTNSISGGGGVGVSGVPHGMKVLIVDDSMTILKVTSRLVSEIST